MCPCILGHGSRTKHQYVKFAYIFSRDGKTKNSKSTAMCFQRQKKVYLKTCSAKRHVFPLRFICSQAKCRRSLNFKLVTTNFNFAPLKKEITLIINKSLDLSFFTVFYFSKKYLIMLQLTVQVTR